MTIVKSPAFNQGLTTLGFDIKDDFLFLTDATGAFPDPQIRFHIEKAIDFDASAVYFRKQLNGSFKPQIYLFDFTDRSFNAANEIQLSEIQKKIWTSGEAPLACIFFKTEIKILDCTTHINEDYTPSHLVNHLSLVGTVHHLYNEQFALKIKSGLFWEEKEFKNKFKFQNSAYDKLIENIRYIIFYLKKEYANDLSVELINKIIVQSILIKYLEERIDNKGNKLLSDKYFKKYNLSETFNDVLKKGKFADLLTDLNDIDKGFNGNIFYWDEEEKLILQNLNLSLLADLLDTNRTLSDQLEMNFPDWRYFEFKYIPVELISRLYEEFLGSDKKEKGLYYTPSHLAKLLVDECLPLKKYEDIDLDNYRILDPACGSGIFLVIAFKRLVQIWRLQNNMQPPPLSKLKKILLNIYGIDKEEQAVRLASFSLCLALCNELNPIDIINNLKFSDLRQSNLIQSDFFTEHILKQKKFDLIIGNPPFNRGAIKDYEQTWILGEEKIKIPQGQIALKFLSESLSCLNKKGLLCLIIKSSGLLYNSTSESYKKLLFSKLNVIQFLDFTALARNKSLWDNGADVATAAIFLRNEEPNFSNNILHLTFRRTKATKERIVFEIDDYDLHFVNRHTAIENNAVWKNNLLGGGRIKSIVEKAQSLSTFNQYLLDNDCVVGEGYIIGTKGTLTPEYIYNLPTIPTEAISENGIDYTQLHPIDKTLKFVKVSPEVIFNAPNIIIWENIGEEKLPVFYNEQSFSFKDKLIGVASKKGNKELLKLIASSFKTHSDFYRFYMYVTSSQVLVNLNTAILKTDIMQLPFMADSSSCFNSHFDAKVIADVNFYMQDFIRHGEKSKAVKTISINEFKNFITNYGKDFSQILNLVYGNEDKKFRLKDVVNLHNSFTATVFTYDSITKDPDFHNDISKLDLKDLTYKEVSKHLSVNRIIKLYPQKDTVVFIKPNQYRFWLSLIAYRDADKCFLDLSNAGI
ncbi:MAG: Adenine-specific methyltransferase Eco57IA [Mucilaginibacter sp.]|nr:Adenine-specific methyltransferase Eco57IA [Mucilaginibacter sp.]